MGLGYINLILKLSGSEALFTHARGRTGKLFVPYIAGKHNIVIDLRRCGNDALLRQNAPRLEKWTCQQAYLKPRRWLHSEFCSVCSWTELCQEVTKSRGI